MKIIIVTILVLAAWFIPFNLVTHLDLSSVGSLVLGWFVGVGVGWMIK